MPTNHDQIVTAPARSGFERHFQTFVGVVVVGLLFWIFDSVQDLSVKVAVQNLNIQILSKSIEKMILEDANDYRADDARRDFSVVNREISDIKKRITLLEKRGYVR